MDAEKRYSDEAKNYATKNAELIKLQSKIRIREESIDRVFIQLHENVMNPV